MNFCWRKINAQSAAPKGQITRMCCNRPNLVQLQQLGCSVSTNAQDAEDCHAAVAARNDDQVGQQRALRFSINEGGVPVMNKRNSRATHVKQLI
jgi:rRNA-processing protein FCF1